MLRLHFSVITVLVCEHCSTRHTCYEAEAAIGFDCDANTPLSHWDLHSVRCAGMDKHERTHGVVPTSDRLAFSCDLCDYRAAVRSSIMRHMNRTHPRWRGQHHELGDS